MQKNPTAPTIEFFDIKLFLLQIVVLVKSKHYVHHFKDLYVSLPKSKTPVRNKRFAFDRPLKDFPAKKSWKIYKSLFLTGWFCLKLGKIYEERNISHRSISKINLEISGSKDWVFVLQFSANFRPYGETFLWRLDGLDLVWPFGSFWGGFKLKWK